MFCVDRFPIKMLIFVVIKWLGIKRRAFLIFALKIHYKNFHNLFALYVVKKKIKKYMCLH